MSLTKRAFVVWFSPSLARHRLKRLSVSRCPRDDLGRLRLPHDVPQALRPERGRPDLPRRRRARPGGFNLQRRDGHLDGRQGLSLVGKVSVFGLSSASFSSSTFRRRERGTRELPCQTRGRIDVSISSP